MENKSLKPFAQDAAWEQLLKMSKNLPQALLMLGPNGVGKKRAVKALFQVLHCEKNAANAVDEGPSLFGAASEPAPALSVAELPCGECVQCRKIADGMHTDLIEISAKGSQIAVDDLREMKKNLYFAPNDGTVRFVIIDDAHLLNASSANSILKTLEEPPAHTRFFLITHERGLLLQTILSRCQFLHFAPLDETTLEKIIAAMEIEIPGKIREIVFALLCGGLARISLLTNEKTREFLELSNSELRKPVARVQWDQIVSFADSLGTDDEKIEILIDLLVWFARKKAIEGVEKDDLQAAMKSAEIALSTSYLGQRLDRNANKKLVALALSEKVHEFRGFK